jgi:hypothetical protein
MRKKANATPNTTPGQLLPPNGGIAVRLYKQGLGDCFVIALSQKESETPYYIVVDSGVLLGTTDQAEKMQNVAKDVKLATNNHINRLIITHEHWDHVSGFTQAKETWQSIKISEIWFAWTEDPADELANELRGKHAKRKTAVAAGTQLVNDAGKKEQLNALLGFHGIQSDSLFGASATTGDAMGNLRTFTDHIVYKHPGEIENLPEGLGRIFVLGPPHDAKQLHNLEKDDALYEKSKSPALAVNSLMMGMDANLGVAMAASASMLGLEDMEEQQKAIPFDSQYRKPLIDAAGDPFFAQHYGFGEEETGDNAHWRRIGDAWLGGIETMALQMDSYTNNTSLAFALEWDMGEGKDPFALLFPGDAQVGNWQSWHEHTWKQGDKTITVPDLLARTVFYKVGHHGSHNATLREQGLELMAHPDLLAYIPVDETMARDKKHWVMPLPSLKKRLAERTNGAVFRGDETLVESLKGVAASRKAAVEKRVTEDKGGLYLDITFG